MAWCLVKHRDNFTFTLPLFTWDFWCKILYACRVSRPDHHSWFVNPNNTWWRVGTVQLLIIQFSHFTCYSLTPWFSVFLDKMVKKFPCFWLRRCITVFTKSQS
jgi:hypothetical protein